MIPNLIPIVLIFVNGFLASRLIRALDELTLAERIAVWFGFGLMLAILNSLILSYAKLLPLLLPVSCVQLIALLLILHARGRIGIENPIAISKTSLNKVHLALVTLLFLSFFLAFLTPVDFLRNSDEYKNMDWAKTLIQSQELVPGTFGRQGIDYSYEIWPWLQKYAYGLSLVYFFQIGGFSLLTGQLLSALFYSMLILAAFLLGSLRSEKTGLLVALLVASNPMIFVFSNHMMTDIPVATLATLSMFFFIKSYGADRTDRKSLLMALLFAGIAVTTKPIGVLLFPLISLYALSQTLNTGQKNGISASRSETRTGAIKVGRTELVLRFLPILIFSGSFLVDTTRIFFTNVPSSSWQMFVDPLRVFTWSLDEWKNYLFSSSSGAFGTFLFPYFYGYGVALLILLGCLVGLGRQRGKLNMLLFGTLVLVLWMSTTSSLIGGFVRHIFFIFPIMMYFAAIGLQSNDRYSLMLIPFLFVLVSIPEMGYVPYVQNSVLPEDFRLVVKVVGVVVVALKLLELLFKEQGAKIILQIVNGIKSRVVSLRPRDLLTTVTLSLVVGSSIYSGYFYRNNGPLELNQNITIESAGIKQAVVWANSSIPENSAIATNNVFEFPFYLSYLSAKKYTVIDIPGTYNYSKEDARAAFLNMTSNGKVDYLILFTSVGYMDWYPYLQEYLDRPPSGMYEVYRTDTFVVYRTWRTLGETGWEDTSFTEGWAYGWSKDSRPAYQMGNYGLETEGGVLHIYGVSGSDSDKEAWAHWIAVGRPHLSIDITEYPIFVVNFRTEDSNTSVQVGVVINGREFYPIDFVSSSRWTTAAVDLRRFGVFGNVTELFLRVRGVRGDVMVNAYFDRISFISEVDSAGHSRE